MLNYKATSLMKVVVIGMAVGLPAAQGVAQCEVQKIIGDSVDDFFGFAVTLSGNTAVIGAPEDDEQGGDSGSVFVFELISGTWVLTANFTGADSDSGDAVGQSVNLDGDLLVVGAPFDEDPNGANSGSAYVRERQEGIWIQLAKLAASDGEAGADFGTSVAILGDTAVVGAPDQGANGAVYLFERDADGPDEWGQVAKLLASDGESGDDFGTSVAIVAGTVLVGAPGDDDEGGNAGAVYTFDMPKGGWQEEMFEDSKFSGTNTVAGNSFGSSLAADGVLAIVGAPAFVANFFDAGAAYIFELIGGEWVQIRFRTAPPGKTAEGDRFGTVVSIFGDTALCGVPFDDDFARNSGSAYLLKRDEGGPDNWGIVSKVLPSDGQSNDQFGLGVAVSVETALVGAPFEDAGGTNAGATYIFANEVGEDCNRNGVNDSCDIANGTSEDKNGDGIPDECAPCDPFCVADLDCDGDVGVKDLLILIGVWGQCP